MIITDIFANTFLDIKGVHYYGYTLYIIDPNQDGAIQPGNAHINSLLLSDSIRNLFDTEIQTLCDPTFVPKDGDCIHVVSPCKYAMDDVRRNYKIKRSLDAGTCNVFSAPRLRRASYRPYRLLKSLIIFPSKKVMLASLGNNLLLTYMDGLLEHLDLDKETDIIAVTEYIHTTECVPSDVEAYKGLLLGTLKTPAVFIDKLNVNSDCEVSFDTLNLIYRLAMDYATKENEKNLLLQLGILNSQNWRKYLGTISTLMEFVKNGRAGRYIHGHLSGKQKFVKELFNVKYHGFCSSEDFDMTKTFLESLYGVGDQKFCSVSDFNEKMFAKSGRKYVADVFERTYNVIVRITPKDFSDADLMIK